MAVMLFCSLTSVASQGIAAHINKSSFTNPSEHCLYFCFHRNSSVLFSQNIPYHRYWKKKNLCTTVFFVFVFFVLSRLVHVSALASSILHVVTVQFLW